MLSQVVFETSVAVTEGGRLSSSLTRIFFHHPGQLQAAFSCLSLLFLTITVSPHMGVGLVGNFEVSCGVVWPGLTFTLCTCRIYYFGLRRVSLRFR